MKQQNKVPPLRKKNGIVFKFFKFFVRFFAEKQVVEYEEKPAEGEVAIFTANHSGAYGPVSMEINFDRPYRPWVIRYLASFRICRRFFVYEFLNAGEKKHQWLYRSIGFLGSLILCPVIKSYSAIRVYHGAKVVNTFNHTIQTLNEGKNVVIFPESNDYYSNYINELNKGFVDIGRMYYNETGKVLKFYPVYIAPGLNLIKVGKPVAYDPEVNYKQQRLSVTRYLRDKIYEMATTLPKHTPLPFTGDVWEVAHEKYRNNMKQYLDLFESIE